VPSGRSLSRSSAANLRVAGGEAAGRRLGAPRGIRPTQGLVREAIFNVLGPLVLDAVVLDLFAGSGALGIEALSRGAAAVTFVDRDESAARVIRRNLEALGIGERGRVSRADVTRWLSGHREDVSAASLVLLDPPYNDPVLEHALALLDSLVAGGTTVVVEHAHRQALPVLERLGPRRQRRYGDTAVSVLHAP
jgi:16S rRNA (guanine966-N2)-methyltransferase